jgi:phosphoglycolate phosphatase
MIGHGLPSLVQKGFADSDMDDQAQVPVAMEYYKAHPSDLSVVFPGVIETLQQLSLPMAIVSNKPTELIAPVLESTGLASFFELQFGGESFPHRKPHPIAAQHCLEHWGLSPKDVLMVGDMQPDADFAKNAGMNFAYCSYGYSDQTIECDHLLETFPACQKLFPASSP